MSGVDLRRAHGNDASILAALHALCFEVAWDAASFSRLLARPGAFALLAVERGGDRAAGFALFEQAADEAEILTIGVPPHFRGRGIASALLAHGCAFLTERKAGCVHLEVAEDNVSALALYRAAGFAVSGWRPGYYGRGHEAGPADALLFTRFLAAPPRR